MSNQDIKFGLGNITVNLDAVVDSARKAAARTVNDVAFDFRVRIQARMRSAFDRPTPGILRSVIVTKAASLGVGSRVTASVALTNKDSAFAQRLALLGRLEEQGGTLQASALGRKQLVIPTDAATLNQYGAFNRGAIRRLIDQSSKGKRRVGKGEARRTEQVFMGTVHGTSGIFRRIGEGADGRVSLLAVFKSSTTYKPCLQWQQTAEQAWSQVGTALKARLAGRSKPQDDASS